MIYLLLANSALILFYLLYRFAFKGLTFFQWNRIYLLLSVLLSLGIPLGLFIQYEVPKMVVIQLPELVIGLNNAKNVDAIDQANPIQNGEMLPANNMQIDYLLNGLYWVGVIAMALWFMYRLILLIKLINNKEGKSNYSFFNKVVVHPKLEEQEMIHQHELIHVRQGHSFDIMLLEIIRIFNWFNPVVYLIIKEMKFQHECIVDQQFDHNKVAYAELLVAKQ